MPLLQPAADGRLATLRCVSLLQRAASRGLVKCAQMPNATELGAVLVELVTAERVVLLDDNRTLALPQASLRSEPSFHGDALRDALLAHLAEVRRWELPASDAAQFVATAREQSQILTARDFALNGMLRSEVRKQVQARLRAAAAGLTARQQALLGLLLAELELSPSATFEEHSLSRDVEPHVLALHNVEPVLGAMAAAGTLHSRHGAGGQTYYLDPALAQAIDSSPARLGALLRTLGLLAPAPVATETPAAEEAPVSGFKQRLRTLRDLWSEGLITAVDYEQRKAEILKEL